MQKAEYRAAGDQRKRAGKGLAGAVLATGGGICWGLSGSMGQYLFRCQGMDSRWLVPYRLGLAGVVLRFTNKAFVGDDVSVTVKTVIL